MKYSWIFIIHFSKYFYVMQPKTIVKIRGWHGSRPGGSNHSLLCMKMYVSLSPWKCDCFEVWMLLAWLWLQNSCRLIKDFNTSFHNLLYWNSATVNSKLLDSIFQLFSCNKSFKFNGFWVLIYAHTLWTTCVYCVLFRTRLTPHQISFGHTAANATGRCT